MEMKRTLSFAMPMLLATMVFGTADVAAQVDYESQIRPILAEHCWVCHGFDSETREGGLRLDLREGAMRGGESGKAAIVPGKPDESLLVKRTASMDSEEIMPPVSHGKTLTPKQKELLRQWVADGAEYSQHWAFIPPNQEPLPVNPSNEQANNAVHPIDAYVSRRLTALGTTISPQESARVLCRRLYLDVIGLPPSPAELTAFEQDGFEATLEKLLSSPRFGERWARPWLDAARYSDTNGYEKDLRREQWAWRDWVIRALNQDLPYNQFIVEQIAGDLLPNATQDQRIATGFLRNSMINEEGAIVPEEFRMVEMFDRLDCIGKSVLGLTTQCAQCHSHKFDPLTQEEYYGLFAFLNNTYEAQSSVYNAEQQTQIERLQAQIQDAENGIRNQRPQWQSELATWSAQVKAAQVDWQSIAFHDLNSVSGLNHPVQQSDHTILMLGHSSDDVYFIGVPDLQGVTGLRLEVLTHSDLPFRGPGRNSLGGWAIRELELLLQKPDSTEWTKVKLVGVSADFSQAEEKRNEGKEQLGPVALLIDGSDSTMWTADRGSGLRNTDSVAVVQFEAPLEMPAGTQLKVVLKTSGMAGNVRCSLTRAVQPTALPVDYDAILALQVADQDRTPEQHSKIFAAWRKSVPELSEANAKIAELWSQYPKAETSVLHLQERSVAQTRTTYFLSRGMWNSPQQAIEPRFPTALHQIEPTPEPKRLQFARWLVDARSPLAARVAVNRVWQTIFGRGLVETSEDFGTRTPVPEYRDVLDWLAVDFMQNKWSTKELIRKIVTSRTYQQSSKATQEQLAADPENRWLSRGARFRVDAEVLRDMAMSMAGLIHHELGGPGIIPPVPQNVLDYNYVYPDYWKPTEGPQRYRRTVYGFRKRSMPDPSMSTLDAPNGDFSCVRRIRSNTPLAALTGLNETIFVESARAFALRVLREGGGNDQQRISYAYQLCMGRDPTQNEQQAVMKLLDEQRTRIAEGWLNARAVATGNPDQLPELPQSATPQDAAAWTIAARVLMNLDETVCKN